MSDLSNHAPNTLATTDAALLAMMPEHAIRHLFSLARDRSDFGRSLLVTELVTLLDRDDVEMNSREQVLVSDIVDELVNNAQLPVRQKLAERLAASPTTPRRLALTLASDHIAVARPILTQSPVLTDSDLVTLVLSQGVDYARAIAVRASIGEALADALVVTGDVGVMQSLAENLGAKISPRAMSALVNAARFAEQLCRPVLERPEMTAEKAAVLYWWVAPALRRQALQRFGAAVGQTNAALDKTIADLLQHHALDRDEDHSMAPVADWLLERDIRSTKAMIQILRLGHFRLFSLMLSRLIELPVPLVDIIITEMGGRSLAVVSRATLTEKAEFVSLFLLSRGARRGEQVVQPRELNHALAAFDRLTPPVAQQMLASWRMNPSYLLDKAHRTEFMPEETLAR
jgi:uncharacterized protein (DUF2336 family)